MGKVEAVGENQEGSFSAIFGKEQASKIFEEEQTLKISREEKASKFFGEEHNFENLQREADIENGNFSPTGIALSLRPAQ